MIKSYILSQSIPIHLKSRSNLLRRHFGTAQVQILGSTLCEYLDADIEIEQAKTDVHALHELGKLNKNTDYDSVLKFRCGLMGVNTKPLLGCQSWNFITDPIQVWKRSRRYHMTMELKSDMDAQGYRPTDTTFNLLIRACVEGGRFERANELRDEMQNKWGYIPDFETFTSLINTCTREGRFEEAMKVKDDMIFLLPKGITHYQIRLYNILFDVCVNAGRLEEAMELKKEMESKKLRLDGCCYNSLINVCAKDSRFEEAIRIKEEFEKNKLIRRPDADTYHSLFNVCTREGRFEDAMKLKQEMDSSGVLPNERSFFSLINVCLKDARYEDAILLKNEEEARGIQINDATYTSLASICQAAGLSQQESDAFLSVQY